MFIALGADDNGRWKEDVNWDDDTGEYKADAANEEWAEMVLAAFRERCDEAVEVKLYGVAPRFWGWVSFAVKVRREMVRWVQEAGVAVRYLTFAEWQERIEWQFEERRLQWVLAVCWWRERG